MSLSYGKIINNIPELKIKIEKASEKGILAATILWHSSLVNKILVGERHGRVYQVPKTKVKYTASAPGEAPARRTGALASSYAPRTKEIDRQVVGELGSPYDYAEKLEKGSSRIAKRPALKPAFHANKERILGALAKNWDI